MQQPVTNFIDVEFGHVEILKKAYRDGLVARHTIVERTAKWVTLEFADAAAAVHAKMHAESAKRPTATPRQKRAT